MSSSQEHSTTYTCKTCSFVCASRRMLSAHKASAHPGKVYKCPLCPFVSCYQANVYRHRRTTHKIGTSTCNVCGLQCQNLDELANHKEIEHGQGLEATLERYEKDKLEAYGSQSQLERAQALYLSGFGYKVLEKQKTLESQASPEDSWQGYDDSVEEEPLDHQEGYAIRNGSVVGFFDVSPNADDYQTENNSTAMELSPLKIRRHYQCKDCDFETLKPKDFLCHRRDVHREKIMVQECPYCIYATRHFQKLQRHCGLVHKDKPLPASRVEGTSPPAPPPKTARKSVPPRTNTVSSVVVRRPHTPPASESRPIVASKLPQAKMERQSSAPRRSGVTKGFKMFRCSCCNYKCKTRARLAQHEKTEHLRNKFFRCLQCNYVTNNRAQYNKHLEIQHSTAKQKCELKCGICDFVTGYKWNLERHKRNHEMDGPYNCTRCSFSTTNRSSLRSHLLNHHKKPENGDVLHDRDEEDEDCLVIDENEDALEDQEEDETEVSADETNEDMEEVIELNDEEMEMREDDMDGNEGYEQVEDDDRSEQSDEEIEIESHQCRFCDYRASSRSAIASHEESHGTSKRYPCPLCGVSFDHVAWLARHLTRKHNEATTSKDISRAAKQMKKDSKTPRSAKEVPVNKSFSSTPSILKNLPAGTTVHTITVPPPKPVPINKPPVPVQRQSQPISHASKSFNGPKPQNQILPVKPQVLPVKPSSGPPKAKKSFSRIKAVEDLPKPSRVESPPTKLSKIESPISREVKPEDIFNTTIVSNRIQHACKFCNYKTRWNSEMEKHCRVHSTDRPFLCPSCKYRCKWKGDLKRHVLKYHDENLLDVIENMKTPPVKLSLSHSDDSLGLQEFFEEEKVKPQVQSSVVRKGGLKIKLQTGNIKKSAPVEVETVAPGRSILKPLKFRRSSTQQDSPLDLTTSRKPSRGTILYQEDSDDTDHYIDHNSENPENESYRYEQPNVVYSPHGVKRKAEMIMTRRRSSEESMQAIKKLKMNESSSESVPSKVFTQRYKCTFCPFMAKTASRFHVHIVQHLNKKPFMCSACFYKSNWEWDITKHIKIKSVRDEDHRSATMMVTDESGRKNYEKYNRFLVSVESNFSGDEDENQSELMDHSFHDVEEEDEEEEEEESNSFNISPEDVETIVVTPDFEGVDKNNESTENCVTLDLQHYLDSQEKAYNSQDLFYCKHCSFKHAEKKTVVTHLTAHAGHKPYQCRICGTVSNWKHVILRHVKMRHGGDIKDVKNRLNYSLDGNVIQLTGLRDDELDQEEVNPESDVTSGKAFSQPAAVKLPSQFQCTMCPYICEKQCYMQFHMKQHRPRDGAVFKCPHCQYWVNFKKSLTKHLKVHADDYGYPNPNMVEFPAENKDSMLENLLLGYKASNVPEEPPPPKKPRIRIKRFQCEFCPYTTDNKKHFLYHKQFHRPNKSAPFKCTVCSYWSNFKHLISQHLNKCHGLDHNTVAIEVAQQEEEEEGEEEEEQPQQQEQQPVIPSSTPTRKLTFLGNTGVGENEVVIVTQGTKSVKMFKCRYCPMMNRRRANVKSHEDMHNSSRPTKFACPICNYQCNSQGVLTSHMKLHSLDDIIVHEGSTTEVTPEEKESDSSAVLDLPSSSLVATSRWSFSYFCPNCPALFKSRSDFQTHFSFHGSGLPFSCDKCDYQARHKPHLHKHFLVHSEEYIARRDKCEPKQITESEESEVVMEEEVTIPDGPMNSAKQMLLLEERETSMFLEKWFGKQTLKMVNKCPFCPAAFQKSSILAFHKYLHEVKAKFPCTNCNYSVNDIKNLTTHQKLHPNRSTPRRTILKIFACNKCPAVFTKSNRYHRHMELHGMKNKFTCDQCDFSVAFHVNLVKHKTVHQQQSFQPSTSAQSPVLPPEQTKPETPIENFPATPPRFETQSSSKVSYSCMRCPYFHSRRDSLNKHNRRHKANQPFQCVHCDYSSIQASFLRDHMKWHFQSAKRLFKPQAFMKYSQLEVWSVDPEGGVKELMFRDKGEDKENSRRFSRESEDQDTNDVEGDVPKESSSEELHNTTKETESGSTEADNTLKQTSVNNIANKLMAKAIEESKKLEVVLTDYFGPEAPKKEGAKNLNELSAEAPATVTKTTSAVKSVSHGKHSTYGTEKKKTRLLEGTAEERALNIEKVAKNIRVCIKKMNVDFAVSLKGTTNADVNNEIELEEEDELSKNDFEEGSTLDEGENVTNNVEDEPAYVEKDLFTCSDAEKDLFTSSDVEKDLFTCSDLENKVSENMECENNPDEGMNATEAVSGDNCDKDNNNMESQSCAEEADELNAINSKAETLESAEPNPETAKVLVTENVEYDEADKPAATESELNDENISAEVESYDNSKSLENVSVLEKTEEPTKMLLEETDFATEQVPCQEYEEISDDEEGMEFDDTLNADRETEIATQLLLAEAEEATLSKDFVIENPISLNTELTGNASEIIDEEANNDEVLQACLAITGDDNDCAQEGNYSSFEDLGEDEAVVVDEYLEEDNLNQEEVAVDEARVDSAEEVMNKGQSVENCSEEQDWNSNEVQKDMLVDILVTAGVYDQTPNGE